MKRLALLFLAVFSSPSKAAISFGATASLVSVALGFDPFPWIIGAFGATVVLVKTQHHNKNEDVINAIICIMLAGLVAPWLAVAASEYFSNKVANDTLPYALAFILSAAWPALIKIGLPVIRKKLEG